MKFHLKDFINKIFYLLDNILFLYNYYLNKLKMKKSNNNESQFFQNEEIKNSSKNLKINKSKELTPFKKSKYLKNQEDESEKNNLSNSNNSKFIKNNSEAKKNQIKKNVFNILLKETHNRSGQEIRYAADYLSKNYKYFINLKNNDSQLKVEKLTKICKLEKFSPGEIIILYGDIGDKFYIVLEGLVEIYKPEYVEQSMTTFEFLKILNKVKEEDELKFERIKNKNDNFSFDTMELDKIDKNTYFMRNKFKFLFEVEDKKGEYGEGFAFGDIALIKETRRNATIKSVDNTVLLSISKDDYNLAMKEIESKKLSKEIEEFQKNFQFFSHFDIEKMIKLFNCFSKMILYKGDYLCHQNDLNDNIYIIIKGSFEIYSYISFSWINEYFNYIDDSLGNILFYMIKNHKMKYSELREIIDNIKLDSLNSPMKNVYSITDEFNMKNRNKKKDNLYFIKNDEEKVNDKNNIFKINLKKIDYQYLIGLEDSFEFKRKFYSVKCISSSAEVKCVKINELLRILWNSSNDDLLYLLKIIINRKNILKKGIINGIKNLEKKILFKLDIRYDNLINYENNVYNKKDIVCLKDKIKNKYFKKCYTKKKEKEVNKVVSAIKAKGYKMSIQDILDEDIKILPMGKSKEDIQLYRTKSAINLNILKNILVNKKPNHHEFKFNKNIINFISYNKEYNSEPKIISRIFSPISSKRHTNYTSFRNNINSIREFSGLSSEKNKDIYSKDHILKFHRIKNYKENSFLTKRNKTPINNYKTLINNNYFKNIKLDEDKDIETENNLNIGNNNIIEKPNLLKINNDMQHKPKLSITRNLELLSPKNTLKMKKIKSAYSQINLIKNKISSATVRKDTNKINNLFDINKKNIISDFIKNKYNYLKNKNHIHISNDNNDSLIKGKNVKRILSNDNIFIKKKEKFNFYNAINILKLKKKPKKS